MIVATKSAAVIVNPRAGVPRRHATPDQIGSLFSAAGLENSISIAGERQDIAGLARIAVRQGFDTVVACGGDGTVGAVANALVGTDTALGVLPAGTLNHFAKDLHIPLDVAAATRVISQRKIELVDVAEVNGRFFVNNSSLGIYPNMVLFRERRRRMGLNKWIALGLAAMQMLRRYPFVDVSIDAQQERISRRTPFVFVGNNEYEIRGMNIGRRYRLDGGRLCLYLATPVSRAGLLGLAFDALFGLLDRSRSLQRFSVEQALIEARRRRVRVSADGEVYHFHAPLHYVLRPRALKVIVP